MLKLDLKDRKILYELDKNARLSTAQLGKKIGLSTEVVHYRLKKLEEHIITGYHTVINFAKIGLIHYKICLKFNGVPLEKEEEYYQKLKKIPQATWIARCRGEWDCMVSCDVKNLEELDLVKNQVLILGKEIILQKAISMLVDFYSQPRDFLVNTSRKDFIEIKNKQPVNLDDIDLKILRILSENSRTKIVEIAQKTNSTIKIVSSRIKKLLKAQVIHFFRLVLDYEQLGLKFYKTFFYLKNPNQERINLLWNKLKSNPHVIHNLKVIGEWDLEPEFEFEKEEDFEKTKQELMNEFSDIIRHISVIDIIKEYKFTFFYK